MQGVGQKNVGSASGKQTLDPAVWEERGGPACGLACTLCVKLILKHLALEFQWKLESFCFRVLKWWLQEGGFWAGLLLSATSSSSSTVWGRIAGMNARRRGQSPEQPGTKHVSGAPNTRHSVEVKHPDPGMKRPSFPDALSATSCLVTLVSLSLVAHVSLL